MSTSWLERRPLAALVLGLFYTLVGSVTGFLFFRQNLSIAVLFFITLLLVPSLMNLLTIEEERERREGLRHFFHNHRDVFEIFLFFSLGIFLGYLVMVWIFGLLGFGLEITLQEQLKVLGDQVTKNVVQNYDVPKFTHSFGLFATNIGVAVIFFVLSFFYGAGSIFLVVWNASIFVTFIIVTIRNISQGMNHSLALLGIFSLYIVPEIAGFLLAAIAGGVVSKAVVVEDFLSKEFKNVVRDAVVLLFLSFALLLLAAVLESYAVDWIKALV